MREMVVVALCSNLLTPVEVFALLTAALCHDLEHPGTNNAYQVRHVNDTLPCI